MPTKRCEERWEHPIYKDCYVRNYRGKACTVIGGRPARSTGLKWTSASRAMAMQILEERREEFHRTGKTAKPKPALFHAQASAVRTCGELWDKFIEFRYPKLSPPMQRSYERYFTMIPPGTPCGDADAILGYIARGVTTRKYTKGTPHKAYVRCRTVFNFGIGRGYFSLNPIFPDEIPAEGEPEPTPYTQEQIDNVEFMTPGKLQACAYFLIGCGCRPCEAIRLEPDDVFDDYCRVYSYKNQARTKRYRVIPFALCPLAKKAVDMALEEKYFEINGKVFGLNNYTNVRDAFNEAIGSEGRGLKDIRKFTINKWRSEGIPEEVRHAIAGHEKEIAEKHYETELPAAELVRLALASQAALGLERPPKAA